MMKIVVQLEYQSPKGKKKALAAVSSMNGVTSIAIDDDTRKLTVLGDVDAVAVVVNLRKVCNARIITAGKPEEKKDDGKDKKKEEKKEEKKQEKKEEKKEDKKEEKKDGKKDDSKKDDKKKDEEKMNQHVREMVESYRNYNPHLTDYYGVHSLEENPNACAIC